MENKLKDASVSETAATQGKLDDVDYHLFVMKDKDYIIKLMTTYGSSSVEDGTEDSIRCVIDDSQPNKWRRITFKHANNFRKH